jgi:hypothetical protein
MIELLRFPTGDSGVIVVEADSDDAGVQRASRSGFVEVEKKFEDALAGVEQAAIKALAVFRDGGLQAETVELEFGIKLNAEFGAIIAKTAAEGHLTVKVSWKRTP